MKFIYILGFIYLAWNLIVFLVVGIDKVKAKMEWYRIREAFLLGSSFLMGALGVLMGMVAFHHKVSKVYFRWLVPIAMIINLAGICGMIYFFR